MGTAVAYLNGAPEAVVHVHENGVEELTNVFVHRWRSLNRKAMRKLENWADAEDAVQEAFLSAFTHLDQFKRRAQMSTWLTTIVINSARLKVRRRPRQLHIPLDERTEERDKQPFSQMLRDPRPNPEEVCQSREITERLVRLTTHLSPTLRRAFQLRDVNGLSIRDTAAILGLADGTVKAQLARARAKLKRLLLKSVRGKSCSI